jgi:hypothetical protein
MRRLRISPVVFVAVLAVIAASCGDAEPPTMLSPDGELASHHGHGMVSHQFVTNLSGDEEVPPVDTRARGQAIFKLSKDGSELSYRLIVANLMNVTMAHIHLAPAGVEGPVVAWLYPSGPPPQLIPGRTSGVLATGVITADDLVGLLAGASIADLVAELESGNAYVNVHTVEWPVGEIRGQIR